MGGGWALLSDASKDLPCVGHACQRSIRATLCSHAPVCSHMTVARWCAATCLSSACVRCVASVLHLGCLRYMFFSSTGRACDIAAPTVVVAGVGFALAHCRRQAPTLNGYAAAAAADADGAARRRRRRPPGGRPSATSACAPHAASPQPPPPSASGQVAHHRSAPRTPHAARLLHRIEPRQQIFLEFVRAGFP